MHKRTLQISAVLISIISGLVTTCCDGANIILDLTSFHEGDLFYTKTKAGRGDNETPLNMLVSTSYHITWVEKTSYRAKSLEEYRPREHQLRPTAGYFGHHSIHIHTNTIQVGPQLVERQQFAVAYTLGMGYPLRSGIDGMLGLNDGVSFPPNVDYLFANLYKQRHIDHLMFSLYINNTAVASITGNNDDQQQPAGALVLGGVDSRYYTGDFQYVKMHEDLVDKSYSNWSMYISDIQLDWSRTGPEKLNDSISRLDTFNMDIQPTRLKLDSSLIHYIGDKKTLDAIHIAMLGADPILVDNFYAFNCRMDNKPDYVFKLMDGFDVRITPEEYVIKYQLNDRQVCLSVFKPSKENVWLFGTKFLRKYYTLFDYENQRIGFAKPT